METEKNREINVKLEPETIMTIKSEATSSLENQLEECNQRIAVMEKNKEGNKELLEQHYAFREKLLAQIKAKANS